MSYSRIEDMREQLSDTELLRLTDDEGLGEIVESRVNAAIANADALIDVYCGNRYQVPLSPAPEIIQRLSVDIAVYELFCRAALEMPDLRKSRHRESINYLESISNGLMALFNKGVPLRSVDGPRSNNEVDTNVFNRKTLEDY